jgi:hypothetical protein
MGCTLNSIGLTTALGATERRQPTDFQRQKHNFHFVKVLFFIALINEQPAQLKDRNCEYGRNPTLDPGSHILPGVRLVVAPSATRHTKRGKIFKVCLYVLRLGAAVASGSMAFLRAQNKHLRLSWRLAQEGIQ